MKDTTIEALPPHQQRVVSEKAELDSKLSKLAEFIAVNPVFPTVAADEQNRLQRQLKAMQEYSAILAERIQAF